MLGQRRHRAIDVLLVVVAVVISISTLLVKQHIVLDVAVGIPWGIGAWHLARWVYPRLVDPTLAPERALGLLVRHPLGGCPQASGEPVIARALDACL